MPKTQSRNSSGRRNLVAAFITVVSVGVLYSSFDPVPAGEDTLTRTAPVIPDFDESSVPTPIEPDLEIATEADTVVAEVDTSDEGIRRRAVAGETLSDMESVRFCTLLLKDGLRFIESYNTYTVTFHREERIDGDMKSQQSIDMKVQHGPHFAVYMKWLTGEKGQQVLYSDEYDDGCMVVKFGGFRRLLPALRIDPSSSVAMAETRYPVTEAGMAGMIKQILTHREADIKRNGGLSCVRLADKEFDGRNCYCFLMKYDSQDINKTYRKTIMLIDAERHLPVMVRNFTWSADGNLADAELDAETLIEDYSFTELEVETDLVAQDFSRDNPAYRM
ncbi:MAG: DUF1571 domain-containing protein [Planctomycetaceae bacterium]|nr:DUF1571 domain-containing protein [Planctomycetaceae bacterium]